MILYNKDLFEKKIIEVYDPVHNQKYWFVRCKNDGEFTSILTQIIPNYDEMVEEREDGESVDGECVDLVIDKKLVIILWCNPLDADALVHECLHAVLFSANSRGIALNDHESLCYQLGFLVKSILAGVGATLRKIKKPKEATPSSVEFNPEVKLDGISEKPTP